MTPEPVFVRFYGRNAYCEQRACDPRRPGVKVGTARWRGPGGLNLYCGKCKREYEKQAQ